MPKKAPPRFGHLSFAVRLDCLHLAEYAGSAPRTGALVWCPRCDRGRVVRWRYYTPSTGWSVLQCGSEAPDGTTRLRCTLTAGHPGDKHLDEPLDAWFAPPGPLRSRSEGMTGRP